MSIRFVLTATFCLSCAISVFSTSSANAQTAAPGCYFNIERPEVVVAQSGEKRLLVGDIGESECHFLRDSDGKLDIQVSSAHLGRLLAQGLIHSLLHELSEQRIRTSVLGITLSYRRQDGHEVLKDALPMTDEMVRFISDSSRE